MLPRYECSYLQFFLCIGSLMSSASRIKSDCGLQGLQEDQIEWFLTNFNVDTAFNKEKSRCIKEKQRNVIIHTTTNNKMHLASMVTIATKTSIVLSKKKKEGPDLQLWGKNLKFGM